MTNLAPARHSWCTLGLLQHPQYCASLMFRTRLPVLDRKISIRRHRGLSLSVFVIIITIDVMSTNGNVICLHPHHRPHGNTIKKAKHLTVERQEDQLRPRTQQDMIYRMRQRMLATTARRAT